jgi:hypothetical protein
MFWLVGGCYGQQQGRGRKLFRDEWTTEYIRISLYWGRDVMRARRGWMGDEVNALSRSCVDLWGEASRVGDRARLDDRRRDAGCYRYSQVTRSSASEMLEINSIWTSAIGCLTHRRRAASVPHLLEVMHAYDVHMKCSFCASFTGGDVCL